METVTLKMLKVVFRKKSIISVPANIVACMLKGRKGNDYESYTVTIDTVIKLTFAQLSLLRKKRSFHFYLIDFPKSSLIMPESCIHCYSSKVMPGL